MKKALLSSYFAGIKQNVAGERYSSIIRYFLPEFITALVLYSLVNLVDAKFIAHLKSSALYATVGVTGTLFHFITKIAEGLSIGAVILCGKYHGQKSYEDVGKSAITALWITALFGIVISGFLFVNAGFIYQLYRVPTEMISVGVPFLKLRAVGIFFMFAFFALIGFLRGVKNTRMTMAFFLLGSSVFLFFDYVLIFGKLGFPALRLQGSAIASIIQYVVMFSAALAYILFDKECRRYRMKLSLGINWRFAQMLLLLSWPVMIDKAVLALAKMWLARLMSPMSTYALSTFTVINHMEMFAFAPAIAFAQVVTFLVSNDFGAGNWDGIKNNIKKILLLSSIMVMGILFLFSLRPEAIISLFDHKREFTFFAARAFPWISVLVFFDLLQLILSGALRGAANVRIVMWVRLVSFICFFMPLSYVVSILPISSDLVKFVMIYGSFYVGNGFMSLLYIYWFRSGRWQSQKI